jgi:phosphoribosylaminoimidazole carboxylase (NCAIR synthetase)
LTVPRVILFATTTGYQIRALDAAAARLGIRLQIASDGCDRLDDPWRDRAIAVRFHDLEPSLRTLDQQLAAPPDGVIAVGDRPTVLAAHAARHFGLTWHAPDAVERSRHKLRTRQRFREDGLATPAFEAVPDRVPLSTAVAQTEYLLPAVVKPVSLSGSRGVIRADTREELSAALTRVRRLLDSHDVRMLRDPDASTIVVEQFIEGAEFAIEAVVDRGRLHVTALFDKPEPLDGPFFEETIYSAPSRAPARDQLAISSAIDRAVQSLGLTHGPIHAECRLGPSGVTVLEVAARPIGGLCAKAVIVVDRERRRMCLEEFLLRHAIGEDVRGWQPTDEGSAVMMVPIPVEGVYRGVDGVHSAERVPNVTDIRITAKVDHVLMPLPEAATYLGFIFARAPTAGDAERAVRDAHAKLRFRIERPVPLA